MSEDDEGYVHRPEDSPAVDEQRSDTADEGYVHTPGETDDADEGYVHRPGDSPDVTEERSVETGGHLDRPSGEPPRKAETVEQEFGWRGWVLVFALVVSFIVVPWSLILFPPARGGLAGLGLPFRDAYLVVPLIPALGLGVLGVWTAIRARQ